MVYVQNEKVEGKKMEKGALLVGMQTGAATMENSVEFPQKTKNETAFSFFHCWNYTLRALKYQFKRIHVPQCL